MPFIEAVGEAAFYGPKIDIQFTTALGREESMSTIQLDFAAKDRFGLSYKDENGDENGEVFVIHRAPLSTHERFVAFLTEHWAGNFPTWLSPVQVQKIRTHRKMRPAYMVILGDEEAENGTVSIRSRTGQQLNGIPLDDFVAGIFAEITTRDRELSMIPTERGS